ncbi:MAG: ATP-binding protein [Myxococcales bacterium]|nr:ATP-binding protein [Myxococcales bacterium]
MDGFVGRTKELELLERAHAAPGGAFIPIYGRRRVGKTELIRKFLARRPAAIYVAGQRVPGNVMLAELLRVAAEALGVPLLAQLQPGSWRDALLAIEAAWTGPTKLVLALDEFQWMVETSPELPAVLQALWDQRWRDSGRVMLILCGSFVGFMEREVLGKKAPLFGRRTAQMLLKPLGYRDAARFHPGYSLTDRARTYFVCGGVPLYLRTFDPARSVEQNLVAGLLDEYAPLHREADFLLREELRDVANYHAILLALAERPLTLTEIGAAVGLGHNVQYHLQQLTQLGYVARRQPMSTRRAPKRAVRYVIDDPLLRFWFRFVGPNQSRLTVPGAQATFTRRIRPALDAYFGSCFERLCREALPTLYAREGVDAAFEIGEYWDRDVQIDVVAVRDDSVVDLGECKWGATTAGVVVKELDAKVARFPNDSDATLVRRGFVRSAVRPTAAGAAVRWHTLADLYE